MDPCPSCTSAHFTRRRVYRASSLAVFFGHFLLVPSVLVVVLGSMGVVGFRPQATRDSVGEAQRASAALSAAGVPEQLAADVAAHRTPAQAELLALSPEQRRTVLEAQMSAADSSTRASMSQITSGSGFRLLVAAALACGVLGAFLVRKHSVAQCTNCGTLSALS